jgi:hypothetical protein
MMLEKNVKIKMDTQYNENEVFQRKKEYRLVLKIIKKHTPLLDRACN